MMRAAMLAQGGAAPAPPVESGTAWELDITRRASGYTLSDSNQTAINTAGGSDYRAWIPTARAILPTDGRRYWEVLCAPGGAASYDGFLGVVPEALRDAYNSGTNPITLGAIGWRGDGTLWSSETATASQRLTGLPTYGAGDVLMFVLDPAAASLWIGKNGLWRDDPVSGAPTWTAGGSTAFYPQIHGRNPGDGGTLRALPAQFSYPVPPGISALGYEEPDLRIYATAAFVETGRDGALHLAGAELWADQGAGAHLGLFKSELWIVRGRTEGFDLLDFETWAACGSGPALTTTDATLYIELEPSA